MSPNARQIVPRRFVQLVKPWYHSARGLRYSLFLNSLKIDKSRMMILTTPGRSGTKYMKFLLANYLKLLSGTSDGPVDANTMYAMFPNTWNQAYIGRRTYEKPSPELDLLGLDDLADIHSPYQSPYWDGSKVLHIYRNPLDYFVSHYFFTYEYRASRAGTVADPVEVMGLHLESYAANYLSYRRIAQSGRANLLRLTYEDLITYPEATVRIILGWLGVEADTRLVELAAQYSSRETMREIEERDGPIDTIIDPDRKFVRDGSIGQWKNYFSADNVELARKELGRFGINLDEFTLEA